jgi:putative cell wall-binding protein
MPGSAHRWAAVPLAAFVLASTMAVGSLGGSAAAEQAPVGSILHPFGRVDAAFSERLMELRLSAAERAQAFPFQFDGCPTATGNTATDLNPVMLRYGGANRYETAVCASSVTWLDHDAPEPHPLLTAQAVVLARGDNFPDALAGGPLAGYVQGPLLLTPPDRLPSAVMAEIKRVLTPGGLVYILGGASSVSSGIERGISAAGFLTRRLAGRNRFETAIAIAEELPDTSNFIFATGRDFPDAMLAGAAAASLSLDAKLIQNPAVMRPYAVLLTDDDTMPASTADFAFERGRQFGGWALASVGGTAYRATVATFGEELFVYRFGGSDRYHTAEMLAIVLYEGPPHGWLFGTGAGLATGLDFPDALAATSSLTPFYAPLLLTHPTRLSSPARFFLRTHTGEIAYPRGPFLDVYGGTSTISGTVANQALISFTP